LPPAHDSQRDRCCELSLGPTVVTCPEIRWPHASGIADRLSLQPAESRTVGYGMSTAWVCQRSQGHPSCRIFAVSSTAVPAWPRIQIIQFCALVFSRLPQSPGRRGGSRSPRPAGRQMTSVAVLCLSWRRRCGFRGRPEGPASQDWLRDHQPPLQVVSGCYDLSFQVEEAEAYRRDVPGAEVYALDAGHFAVDAQPGVIADLALGFLQRRQARTDG
jgi:pimeloyl-ACP methyl ester carboxylesterase